MYQTLKSVLRKLEHDEIFVLVGILIILMGSMFFIYFADEVSEGATQRFDERVLLALRQADGKTPIGPFWVHEIGRDLTALGGYCVLISLVTLVSIFLYLDCKKGAMAFLLTAVVTGYLMGMSLKAIFSRPRPTVVPYLTQAYNTSFPSGHSLMSAIVYLTLGAILARFSTTHRIRLFCLIVALGISGLVGISRVYLGVHYPSDVLAGWCAGLVWATLCSLIAQSLQNRGVIEKEL